MGESDIQNEQHKVVEISFSENKNSPFSIEIPDLLEPVNLAQRLAEEGSSTSEENASLSFNGSLEITVLKATDLQKKDLFQKADPYVVVELDNQKSKTEKKKNNLNPEWNQTMTIQIHELSSKFLSFKVYDWDRFGKDDIMGQTSLEIEDLITNSQGKIIQLPLQDCKSGTLFVSVKFEGEIKKMSRRIQGVRELKKHLKEDQSNTSEEEITMKGVKELKDYLLDDDTELKSKKIITRKTTKTTKVLRKVVIDEHGNKTDVEKDFIEKRDDDNHESVKIEIEKEKDAPKSEWVSIPIIRLDKEPSSPAVQIEELSDEEQTEPLDLTNKLVVEGVVSTPSDEENVAESVEIVEITEEPHKPLSNTSSLSSTSSSVITVVELDQKNVDKGKDKTRQEKWTVNMPIIRTTPTDKPSDEDKEKKRWSVNIPIIREPENKLDENQQERERENVESIKVFDVKEEEILPIAQEDNKSQESSAKIIIQEQEKPKIVPEGNKVESSSVSHKVTGFSMTDMHSTSPSFQTAVENSTQDISPLLNTENIYSTVAHQVFDVTEKPSESPIVLNTTQTGQGSSSLTHKVSQIDNDLKASIVAHQVHESPEINNLPVNPLHDQGEDMKDSTAKQEDQFVYMEEDQSREKTIIKTLENENQQLKAFIPDDILDNLPTDLQQSLLQEVYQARDSIVKKDLMDTMEERKDLEIEEKTPVATTFAKEDNLNQSSCVTKPLTSNIEELMEIVDSLDEETSKYVLDELQNVLTEIDDDIKAQKIASLREDLIKLQMEQSNLMPSLPAEILTHLPPEILQGIEGAMKDAYLEMAKEDPKEEIEKEEIEKHEVEKIITEYFDNGDEPKEEEPKDKRSEVENIITEFMESDEEEEDLAPKPASLPVISSIPEELLNTLPPEMAAMLQASFNSTMPQLSPTTTTNNLDETSQQIPPRTPPSKKTSLTLNVDDQRDSVTRNNDTDNDDVSLPPTPAVQPSWSFIASQPVRPQAPTPDSGSNSEIAQKHDNSINSNSESTAITQQVENTTNSNLESTEKTQQYENSTKSFSESTEIAQQIENTTNSNSESTEITQQHENSTMSKFQTPITQKDLDLANATADKVITDAKSNLAEHQTIQEDVNVTVTHITDEGIVTLNKENSPTEKRKSSTIISTQELHQDQAVVNLASEFVTKTIDDAKKIVMRISDDENESTLTKSNFQDTQTVEQRNPDEEDKKGMSSSLTQASSTVRFQETQVIKSRTCIEEDRFSRNDMDKIVMNTADNDNAPDFTKKNIQETQTVETRHLVQENKCELSSEEAQSTSEATVSFQEIQIEKSRTCIEEDRFQRNDTAEQMPEKEANHRCVEETISATNDSTKTMEGMETKADDANEEVSTDENQIITKINEESNRNISDGKDSVKSQEKIGDVSEKSQENVHEVKEVDFQRISDEELLCMENIKSMTENLKRKLSDTKKPNNKYRFESKTVKTTEEVKEIINNDMRNTRSAIQRKHTIVIEQTIITIVETVSDWLDRVEYKISTVKRIKTINQRKEELKNIKDEIEVIEETVDELVEVTELAVEVLNDESKVTITSCVQCLTENVKIVKLQRQQSEDELSDSEDKWDEYLEGVKTVASLIQDLRAEVERVENTDDVLEEKIDTFEGLEIMNKGHLNKVTYLFATGNGLTADLQENKVPEEVIDMLQNVRKIENHIQNDKDSATSLLISKSEYEQTLQEYESIIQAAEFFLTTKVKITELSQLENEITKQKKFFINLSHCVQVLSSLEEGFSTEILDHFKEQHEKLNEKSMLVLNKAAHHVTSLDLANSKLSKMDTTIQEIKSKYLQIEKYKPGSLEFSTENYTSKLENLKKLKIKLCTLENHFENIVCLFNEVEHTINLEDYRIDFTLKHDILDQLDTVNHHIKKLEKFSDHWQSYEENYTVIQQWLGSAEEELDKEGSTDLITSEQQAIKQNFDNGHLQFLRALEDNNVLDEEEQRTFKLQVETRWQQIGTDLKNIKKSRKEIQFNNLQDICHRTEEIIDQGNGALNLKVFENNENLLLFVKKISFLKLKAERIQDQLQQTNLPKDNTEAIEKFGRNKRKVSSIIKQLEEKSNEANSTLDTSCSLQREISKIIKNVEKFTKEVKLHPHLDFRLQFKEIESEAGDLLKTFKDLKLNTLIVESNTIEMSTLQTILSDLHQSMEQNKKIMQDKQTFNQDLQRKIQDLDNSTNEANFKMDLTLARGHIDLKRLKSSSEKIKVYYL